MAQRSDLEYTQVSRRDQLVSVMSVMRPDDVTVPTVIIQRAQSNILMPLITAYRLLDVINRNLNPNNLTSSPRYSKLGMSGLRPGGVCLLCF
jgi:hypothetical protein